MSDELDQSTETSTEAEDSSYYGMSDSELMNLNFEDDSVTEEEVVDAPLEDKEEIVDEATDEVEEEEAEVEEDLPEEEAETDAEEQEEELEETVDEDSELNYKTEYEKLLQPFKANGKQMQVDNVDEAIQLMQMGANYNKKIASLKPGLKTLKMLEDNDLLDDKKLGFLIDLDKKNPEAIKKLIKDSGIDPLDVDVDADTEYTPNTYTVDDQRMALEEVISDIQDTEAYSKTSEVIGTKWDDSSKEVLFKNPELIKLINGHVESGIFDKISARVEKDRLMGRLTGVSDLAAYKQAGDALHAEGAFGNNQTKPKANVVVRPKAKSVDPKLKTRRKAASTTKTSSKSKADVIENLYSMSDEEIEKLTLDKFL